MFMHPKPRNITFAEVSYINKEETMNKKYDHHAIERKWQEYWEKNQFYKVIEDPNKPK
jgi:hypothetical protein